MANTDEKIVSLNELSHFKAKQDLENEQKFKKKDDATDLKGAVRYDAAQVLTEQEKAQAKANLGITGNGGGSGGTAEGAVLYTVEQLLTEEQKTQARANIGAVSKDEVGEAGAKSWEDLGYVTDEANYPSYTWDGDTTGKVSAEATIAGMPCNYYRVGAPMDIYNSGTCYNYNYLTFFNWDYDIVVTEHFWAGGTDARTSAAMFDPNFGTEIPFAFNVHPEKLTVTTDSYSITFPEGGVYFLWCDGNALGLGGRYLYTKELKATVKTPIPEELVPDTVVKLDENGLIPASQIPGMFDETVEGYYNEADHLFYADAGFTTPIEGEKDKFYFDLNSTDIYRFGGSIFGIINPKTYTLATTSDIDALFS